MSGSAGLPQLRYGLMSYGHADVHGLSSNLRPCLCMRVMLPLGPYGSQWFTLPPEAMVILRPTLQAKAVPESVAVLQPGSMLSVIHVINGAIGELALLTWAPESWSHPSLASAVDELPSPLQKTRSTDAGMAELAPVFKGQLPSTFMATKVRELALKTEKLVPPLPVHTPKICP